MTGLAVACLTAVVGAILLRPSSGDGQRHAQFPVSAGTGRAPSPPQDPGYAGPLYKLSRRQSPDSTVVSDRSGQWLATFTDGSRTVALKGARRSFTEPRTTAASVTHDTWIRMLERPFDGTVDSGWLSRMLADTSPDLLAVSMQYVDGAASQTYDGLAIAGDASYGPERTDTTGTSREEGSDFNDYLGVAWRYENDGDGSKDDKPERRQSRALDCSGYMRMVWGYRSGLPLSLNPASGTLPRRAVTMETSGPGTVIIRNSGSQAIVPDTLQIGDLVFFDASKDDGTAIDHVGLYLGRDDGGHHRFLSSRKAADGPTLGDAGGTSLLDGTGHYASSFRSARRL